MAESQDRTISKLVRKRLSEESVYQFGRQAWHVVEPGKRFVPGWHIEAVCEHLEAVDRGEIKRLVITVPPRSSKSLFVSVLWPAWTWIRRPEYQWLSVTHTDKLATRDTRKMRTLVQSPWYQERWPMTFVKDENLKSSFINDSAGYRIGMAIGAGVTGWGGDGMILDDPMDRDQAFSEVQRQAVLVGYRQKVSNRLNDMTTGAIVAIAQRLHQADLMAYLIESGFDVLCIPMRYEKVHPVPTTTDWKDPRTVEGELMCPERFPEEGVADQELVLGPVGCNPGEAPVLMVDLSLKSIAEIKQGDFVVGFTRKERPDGRKGRLTLVRSEVLGITRRVAPVVKMALDSGEIIRCTRDHKWFTKTRGPDRPMYLPVMLGRSRLARVCPARLPVFGPEDERLAGWLSGFFDAEGTVSICHKASELYPASSSINIFQGAGRNLPLCQKLERALDHFGFDYTVREDQRKDNKTAACYGYRTYRIKTTRLACGQERISGGALTTFQRFLHIVQPTKWRDRIIEGAYRSKFILGREKVVSITPENNEKSVYSLKTTTGNYVVWGFASSNSAGQLQQRPSAAAGSMFEAKDFRYFSRKPTEEGELFVFTDGDRERPVPSEGCVWFQAVDTAMKVSDDAAYTVCVTIAVTPQPVRMLVVDVFRQKLTVPDQYEALRAQLAKWPMVKFQAVEEAASGIGIFQQAQLDAHPMLPLKPHGSKETRASTIAMLYGQGAVYHLGGALWLAELEDELLSFPTGTFKDQVDSMAWAGIVLQSSQVRGLLDNRDLVAWPAKPDPDETEEDRGRRDALIYELTGRAPAGRQIVRDRDDDSFGSRW